MQVAYIIIIRYYYPLHQRENGKKKCIKHFWFLGNAPVVISNTEDNLQKAAPSSGGKAAAAWR
jgi:hypothetical protein